MKEKKAPVPPGAKVALFNWIPE